MVMNWLIHQESVTANLHQFTSNPIPLLPTTSPVVLDVMGRINNNSIYNGDAEV